MALNFGGLGNMGGLGLFEGKFNYKKPKYMNAAAQGDVTGPVDTGDVGAGIDNGNPDEMWQGRGPFDGGGPGSPTADPLRNRIRRGGRAGGRYGQDWKFDPITGKPIATDDGTSSVTVPTTPTATGAFDFWGSMRELMDDPTDPMADETWQGLMDVYAQDPKWKAPTTQTAQRLIKTAQVFKQMGYDNETLMPLITKAFDLGYNAPRWNLSLFNRLLGNYGLGAG